MTIAEHSRGPVRVAMGIAGRSHLRGRVLAILGGPRVARVEPGVLVILGVLLALSCLMFFIATATAAPAQPSGHGSRRASPPPVSQPALAAGSDAAGGPAHETDDVDRFTARSVLT